MLSEIIFIKCSRLLARSISTTIIVLWINLIGVIFILLVYPCLNKILRQFEKKAFLVVGSMKKHTVYWQNKHMQMCREWSASVICLKTSCAPWSFVPPINHVTNFTSVAWSLIDKLTSHLASGKKRGRKICTSPRILVFREWRCRESLLLQFLKIRIFLIIFWI